MFGGLNEITGSIHKQRHFFEGEKKREMGGKNKMRAKKINSGADMFA